MKPVYVRRYQRSVWGFMCGCTPLRADVDFWCADAMRIFSSQAEAVAFGLEHVSHHDPETGALVPTVAALLHLAG